MNIGLKFLQSTLRVKVNRSSRRIKLFQSIQKVSAILLDFLLQKI